MPLVLLVLVAGGLILARRDGVSEADRLPTPARSPTQDAGPSLGFPPRSSSTASMTERAAVQHAARTFLTDYLALLHGRRSPRRLRHATSELLRELRRRPPRAIAARNADLPRVRPIGVTPRPGGSMRAVAVVRQRAGPPYALWVYLERRGERWLVIRIGDA